MSARIRGHYRINAVGQVMPLTDVNGGMKAYSLPLPKRRGQAVEQRSRIMKMAVAGLTLFSIAVAAMSVMPQIERSVVAAQASRIASARSAFFRSHPEFHSHHWRDPAAEN